MALLILNILQEQVGTEAQRETIIKSTFRRREFVKWLIQISEDHFPDLKAKAEAAQAQAQADQAAAEAAGEAKADAALAAVGTAQAMVDAKRAQIQQAEALLTGNEDSAALSTWDHMSSSFGMFGMDEFAEGCITNVGPIDSVLLNAREPIFTVSAMLGFSLISSLFFLILSSTFSLAVCQRSCRRISVSRRY